LVRSTIGADGGVGSIVIELFVCSGIDRASSRIFAGGNDRCLIFSTEFSLGRIY